MRTFGKSERKDRLPVSARYHYTATWIARVTTAARIKPRFYASLPSRELPPDGRRRAYDLYLDLNLILYLLDGAGGVAGYPDCRAEIYH